MTTDSDNAQGSSRKNKNSKTPVIPELRFTRAWQSIPFFFAALGLACLSFVLLLVSLPIWTHQSVSLWGRPWYALIPLPFAGAAIWTGIHLCKHAYFIFTPLGIELFSFWRPSKNLQLVSWAEVESVTADDQMLEIALDGEKDSAIFVSLAPLRPEARQLLQHTCEGVMKQKEIETSVT